MSGRSQPGWAASGIVEAPVERVWQALLDANPVLPASLRKEIEAAGDAQSFVTSTGKAGEGRIQIEVDKVRHHIAIEGEWWYRGVYSVEPHEHGSLLAYSVYNIAPGAGWWAAQLLRGPQYARGMQREFGSLLQVLGDCLNCKAALLAG